VLNDAQNKHDGEQETSLIVVDVDAFVAAKSFAGGSGSSNGTLSGKSHTSGSAGSSDRKKQGSKMRFLSVSEEPAVLAVRKAATKIGMGGHYHHKVFDNPSSNAVFWVPGTAHYVHYMSRGGHGAYLELPPDGLGKIAMGCTEKVGKGPSVYNTWQTAADQKDGYGIKGLVEVTNTTPWLLFNGRWGKTYYTVQGVPLTWNFSGKNNCDGPLEFIKAIKSAATPIMSAPRGPFMIHETASFWANFPGEIAETRKDFK